MGGRRLGRAAIAVRYQSVKYGRDYDYGPMKSTKRNEVKLRSKVKYQSQVCKTKDYDYGPVKSKETLLK